MHAIASKSESYFIIPVSTLIYLHHDRILHFWCIWRTSPSYDITVNRLQMNLISLYIKVIELSHGIIVDSIMSKKLLLKINFYILSYYVKNCIIFLFLPYK